MVYYFTSDVVKPSAFIYVGKDKVENEDLIKFGLEEDVWFHADKLSRNKKDNVTIIYTPWSNLKKDGSMAVGQVSFKDNKKVKRILVPQRENPIVNRLNKTKVEKFPDLGMEKEEKLKALRKKDQAAKLDRKKEEARIAQERKEKKWQKEHAYDDLFQEEDPEEANNQDRGEDFLDDFISKPSLKKTQRAQVMFIFIRVKNDSLIGDPLRVSVFQHVCCIRLTANGSDNCCTPGAIGHALTKEFHSRGFRVIATGRSVSKIASLEEIGISCVSLVVDDRASVVACHEEVKKLLDGAGLDFLISNSGKTAELDIDEARDLFSTNVLAVMDITQTFLPELLLAKGKIVNMGSVAGHMPLPFMSLFCASKAALYAYSECLRLELAPLGVKVTYAQIGNVKTPKFLQRNHLSEESLWAPVSEGFERRQELAATTGVSKYDESLRENTIPCTSSAAVTAHMSVGFETSKIEKRAYLPPTTF
ncbi:hypothetical protein G7Y89_g3130 [Cudoniella acicularis]|uniref:NFACT RNA-binding domain-containing protein n=1 Tax=Cudoniella acicularis TaxID=354080 RepID=A0A8H4RS08_9HELO|nr:hypothetical protein G7Y89_g3130 [Cudoniella acicularis]